MTESEIIDLCCDIERLAFGPEDYHGVHPPRRFDSDPAAYEALKKRVREMNVEYEIGWDHVLGHHYVRIHRIVSCIKRDHVSEPIAFLQALRVALNGE